MCDHRTPLHSASLYGRLDIVRFLLDHGATSNSEDKFGRTPLHLVVKGECNSNLEQDRVRTTQLLLDRGADVNAQTENGATPLHLASYLGRVDIARVLLDRGASANSKGRKGRTPLHCVAQGRHLYSMDDGMHVAQLLLERGADANAPDEDKRTPLHLASSHGNVEIAQVLLDGGASANSLDIQGQTPLHVVANGSSRDDESNFAQLLLDRGADVNAPDDAKETPLHLASKSGRIKTLQVLLNAGANARAKNAQDQSPFDVISRLYDSRGDARRIARLLLEHGADVDAQDKYYAIPSESDLVGVIPPLSALWRSQSDPDGPDPMREYENYRRETFRHTHEWSPSSDSDSGKRMVATFKATSLTIALQASFLCSNDVHRVVRTARSN